MTTVIKTRIIRIGDSLGVRIPKLLLKQLRLTEGQVVALALQPGQIVAHPAHKARRGWEAAFKAMAERGDDEMLDGDLPSTTE